VVLHAAGAPDAICTPQCVRRDDSRGCQVLSVSARLDVHPSRAAEAMSANRPLSCCCCLLLLLPAATWPIDRGRLRAQPALFAPHSLPRAAHGSHALMLLVRANSSSPCRQLNFHTPRNHLSNESLTSCCLRHERACSTTASRRCAKRPLAYRGHRHCSH
jgi:hypothetical protein